MYGHQDGALGKAYQCAMTWALQGGDASYLNQVYAKYQDNQGFGLQRAMIRAVTSYRTTHPDGTIDLSAAPDELRLAMMREALVELGGVRSAWNSGQIADRLAQGSIRNLVIVMAAAGADQTSIRQQLTGFQGFAMGQYSRDTLLDDIWKAQNPRKALAIDLAIGFPFGVGAAIVERALLNGFRNGAIALGRTELLGSDAVTRSAISKVNEPARHHAGSMSST